MRIIRKRSKRASEQEKISDESKRYNKNFWFDQNRWKNHIRKIVVITAFLALLGVLFLYNDDLDIKKSKKYRLVPDPENPLPPSSAILHSFRHAAVSSDSQVCSDIARNVLKNGGNIFDGAFSAILCNSMTQMQSMGLFGGFLLTFYRRSDQKSMTFDAQMTSPKNFKFSAKNATNVKGRKLIGTPGLIVGLQEIHAKYGSFQRNQLIAPILALCYKGLTVTKHLHDSMHLNNKILDDPYLKELFQEPDQQSFKRVGSNIIVRKNCEFLEVFANHTDADIYSGVVGDLIVKDFQDVDSFVTTEDLKEYKVRSGKSTEFQLSNDDTLFFPNTAVLVPAILNILKKFHFNASSFDFKTNKNETILTHHRIIEAFKHVFAARTQLGDPDFVDVKETVAHMLSEDYAEEIFRKIDSTKTFADPRIYSAKFITPNTDGTSHISIIAANGDALSVTSSINYYFGAGCAGVRTGLVFNNGLDDFSFPQRSVNYFGLEETPTNYPQPGKRALSSMSPIIVVNKAGDVKLVIGSAGGSRIISALALAILRFSCCTHSIKDVVDFPRFHHQLVPDATEYEFGVVKGIVDNLSKFGHKLKRFKNRGTIINALAKNKYEINGIADYRKDWSGVAGY